MRVRKLKHGDARRQACREWRVSTPSEITDFTGENKILLEIGAGKGDFSVALAERNPDKKVLAVEVFADVALHIMEKARDRNLVNLRVLVANAANLSELLAGVKAEVLYLNFSDPWPKTGHAKRRLTHRAYLEMYKSFFGCEAKIEFKTDNDNLFLFTLAKLKASGYTIAYQTRDLHSEANIEDNIETEYERFFAAQGKNINKLIAEFKISSANP